MTYRVRSFNCEQCGCAFTAASPADRRFCGLRCANLARHAAKPMRAEDSPNWKGGKKRHPLYSTWCGMIARCENPRHRDYPHYGGRGIIVCPRWRSDFWNFVADMGERPDGQSLDRVDGDGPYSPENVRWATALQQTRNRRAPTRPSHCKRGHSLTGSNVRVRSNGTRQCNECARRRTAVPA